MTEALGKKPFNDIRSRPSGRIHLHMKPRTLHPGTELADIDADDVIEFLQEIGLDRFLIDHATLYLQGRSMDRSQTGPAGFRRSDWNA